jgi:anaerobic selenocysteine-containing dehydrogenase/Ni/Fe-hydrogenase subunit HybB-like protein
MSRTTIRNIAVGAWVLLLLAGLAGVGLRLATGEELVGYGSYIPWGLWIALYAWFVGVSTGAYMLFAIGEVFGAERLRACGRPALVVSLTSLISGLVVVGLDLGHFDRFWHVYVYGNPESLMAWEIAFYTAFLVLTAVTFVVVFKNDIAALARREGAVGRVSSFLRLDKLGGRRPEETGWVGPLALVGAILAFVVSGATGALFGVVGARPYWHTGLLPLLFIAVAFLSAAAVLAVLAAATPGGMRERQTAFLGRLTLVLLAVTLIIEWADISVAFYSSNLAAWDAYELALTGAYWWVFWGVHLLAGVAVPIVILLWKPRSLGWVAAAAGLVAVTLISVRLNVVVPGLAVPQIEGLDEAFVEEGLTLTYFPSLMEWLVSLFAAALFIGLMGAWYVLSPFTFEAASGRSAAQALAAGGSTRSQFIGHTAIAGGAVLAAQLPLALHRLDEPGNGPNSPLGDVPYPLSTPENVLYTVCQQCNTQCGIKAKLQDGVVIKVDGSPYSPWAMSPPIAYDTPLDQAAAVDGWVCPKGQAGIQTLYDPYRITKVLKRVGPRGSGRWRTIDFKRAVEEIVEGGDLFGEGAVPGLRESWALTDPDASNELADDVKAIADGELTVAGFKQKYAKDLDKLIDPDHPDLGPKNNQVVFAWGRLKGGRSELLKRFISDSFGSANAHGHTTVCQGSLYFGGKAMSEQFTDGKWQKGAKAYWQADVVGSEFVVFVGASPFEANYGPPWRTSAITDGIAEDRLKIAVVDPRLSKTAAKAWKWLPIQPGTEGALALAMIRWIIDDGRYDRAFLASANKAAAAKAGETTWTNAAWLVHADGEHKGMLIRASEIGLKDVEIRTDSKGEEYEFDYFVALVDGKPVAVDPEDEANPVSGDLLVSTALKGMKVKSGLQLLYESSKKHTMVEWAGICGVAAADIVALAREFTSHGKKAAADIHRGVSQHTNGYYNVIAWNSLNALVGNYDWKGGMAKATTYNIVGDKDGEPVEGMPFVLKDMHPAKMKPFGISIIRHDTSYEKSTIFDDYPAKRPWFPLSSDVYQEIVPSIGDAYPYPVKALFLYMGTPVYALPGGHTNIEVLKDPKKLPLFVASDITIGETSMYADYIFPDATYLERWELAGSHPSVTPKVMPIRQPVVAPLTETVEVFGERQPLTFESMLFGLAEQLNLPGFGPNGLEQRRALSRPEDLYLLMAANVASGDGSDVVPSASGQELSLFVASRRHLPATVFDAKRWRKIVGAKWWPKTVFVLNRGGRFSSERYDGEQLANPYGKQLNVYMEKTAKSVNSMTGEHYSGVARYFPAPTSAIGEPVVDPAFPLRLITFREITHTKSRTIVDYWLLANLPENALLLNVADAKELGFRDGDWARLVSATNPAGVWPLGNGTERPMVGKIKTTQGLRPGVVAFSLGHGHWAYGASDVSIDGDTVKGDKRRAKGFHGNAAMRLDPHLKDVCLSDLTGGSAVFYDTSVKLERASASDARLVAV